MVKCNFEDCEREAKTKGLCRAHYSQQRRGVTLHAIREPTVPATCSFEGCERPTRGTGPLCDSHRRQRNRGRPLTPLAHSRRETYRSPVPFPADPARETRLQRECRQLVERLKIPLVRVWDEGLTHMGSDA